MRIKNAQSASHCSLITAPKGGVLNVQMCNDNDFSNTLFERTYDVIMSDEQKKEAYLFYSELNHKNEIRFQYYTECSSTYGEGTYFSWCPMSLELFLEKTGI